MVVYHNFRLVSFHPQNGGNPVVYIWSFRPGWHGASSDEVNHLTDRYHFVARVAVENLKRFVDKRPVLAEGRKGFV